MLVDVTHEMDCVREETFGPTLPIMKVADAEEAIRLANDSDYGPGGIRKYCRQQSLLISRVHLSHDFRTYPYRTPKTRLLARALKVLYGRRRRG